MSRNKQGTGVSENFVETVKSLDTVESQAEYIAKKIAECASELRVPPSDVIWLDFREHIKRAYGQDAEDILPKLITRLGGFNSIRDSHFPAAITSTRVERIALVESARLNRKFASQEVYDKFFMDKLIQTVTETYKNHPVKVTAFKPSKPGAKTERHVNLMLSDLHFQSLIRKGETGHAYGNIEEARRISYIAKQLANYKLDHRDETELNIILGGDIIQNQLHDARDGSPLAEQMVVAIRYLTEMIGYLASAYKAVTIYCTPGNHGRNTTRHKSRAVNQKWDSQETAIYYALANTFAVSTPNVKFVIPQTPWVDYESLGHPIYGTHGDTVFNPGNPGKTVDTAKLQVQANNLNASRRLDGKPPYKIIAVGHVHRAMLTHLDTGVAVLTNGPLCPPDGFAVSIGINSVQCGQWMWETTKAHPLGDFRFMAVGKEQDADASLDEIVKPHEGGIEKLPQLKKFKR